MVPAVDEAPLPTEIDANGTDEPLADWHQQGMELDPGLYPGGIPGFPPFMMPGSEMMPGGPQEMAWQMPPPWLAGMPMPFPGVMPPPPWGAVPPHFASGPMPCVPGMDSLDPKSSQTDMSTMSVEALQEQLDQARDRYDKYLTISQKFNADAEALNKAARPKMEHKKPRTPNMNKTDVPFHQCTTLMLRNLPNDYKPEMLLQLLDDKGLKTKYDFVYLPMDFQRKSGLGYAFVNMASHEDAEYAMSVLNGFTKWGFGSTKVLTVNWATRQGLDAYLQFYRNNPVMHSQIPENYKPMFFVDGNLHDFPIPTKKVRAPRPKARGAKGGEK